MVKMRILIRDKKGILFTLGLTFLALVVLALAVLIFHNAQEFEGMVAKLAVLDRVYDLDTSIGQSVGVIFKLKSGISINITNESISFEEVLPNDNIATLNNSLRNFKRYIEANLSNVNLTITNTDEMLLRIFPDIRVEGSYIDYKHKTNWSDIEVLPTSSPDGYSIFISTDKNVSCSSSFNTGSFNLSYEVRGDAQSCDYTSEKITPADDKELTINSPEDGDIILIKVGGNGRLLINLTQDITVTARTTIIRNFPEVGVMADWLSLKLDFGDFGVSKESEVRVI